MIKEVITEFSNEVGLRFPQLPLLFSPSSNLSQDTFRNLPKLVCQGPEIINRGTDFTIITTETGATSQGVKISEQRYASSGFDLRFRMRLFHNSLTASLRLIEQLSDFSVSLCEITYNSEKFFIHLEKNWQSDTVPNFSDLKHFESSLVIGTFEIPKTNADREVFELLKYSILANQKTAG